MSRKTKTNERRRLIALNVTEDEMQAIQAAAASEDRKVAPWVRRLILREIERLHQAKRSGEAA